MARDDPHFRLRFPDALREKVEAAAKANHRSMTAEIIARLEASFQSPPQMGSIFGLGGPPGDEAKELVRKVDELIARADRLLGEKEKDG